MYEIWLGINIVYEWCLLYPQIPMMMAVALLAAYLINRKQHKNWREGMRPALIVAAIAFVILFFVYPWLVKSSITEMAYFTDWLNHLGICFGLGGFFGLVAWPFTAARKAASKLA